MTRWDKRWDSKVIHLIVEYDSSGWRQEFGSKWKVDSCGHCNSISICIHNAKVASSMVLKLTPPSKVENNILIDMHSRNSKPYHNFHLHQDQKYIYAYANYILKTLILLLREMGREKTN